MYLHACLPIRVDIGGTGTGHRLGRFVGLPVHVGNLYFFVKIVAKIAVKIGVVCGIVCANGQPGQPQQGGGRQAS